MNKREQLIKRAFGEHFDLVKDHIDQNAWCPAHINPFGDELLFEVEGIDTLDGVGINGTNTGTEFWRPKVLKGIETNNGWITIESKEDYPKETLACHVEVNKAVFLCIFHKEAGRFECVGGGQVIWDADAWRPLPLSDVPKRVY